MSFRNLIKKALVVLFLAGLPTAVAVAAIRPVPSDILAPDPGSPLEDTLFQSNRHTQVDDFTEVENDLAIPGNFALVAETEELMLYAEEPSGAIRVVVKADGYVFGSSFAAASEPIPHFNETWEGIVNSAAVIEYYFYNETNGAYIVKEESLFTSDATTMAYRPVAGGYELAAVYGESGIGLTVRVTLDGPYLRVEVPSESISEGETYKLRSVKCFPFFGSVYGDSKPGYVLVPDGAGALVRYRPIDAVTDIYEFNYYGTDQGIVRSAGDDALLQFPVSGMVQGIRQHAFVAIVESGDEFATLVVSPAKNNLKYYYSYNRFVYRGAYRAPASKADAASGSGSQVIQEERNSCDAAIVYAFLAGDAADYVGMANAYQDYLRGTGVLADIALPAGTVPALVELVGAEPAPGFLFDEMRAMTTYAAADRILSDLATAIPAVTAVYKGWSAGGLTDGRTPHDRHEPALGTRAELLDIVERHNAGANSLSLYVDPATVSEDGSYSVYRDVAKRIDSSLHTVTGIERTIYRLNPLRTVTLMADAVSGLSEDGVDGLAVGSLGWLLFSDYQSDDPIDRAEAAALYGEALSDPAATYSVYRAGAYLLRYAKRDLAIPTSTSGFAIYTDTVPFVSILLAGAMEAYGPYANFFADRTEETLRLIDHGLLPSFILTEASAYLLNDTELRSLYSSSYATWSGTVREIYGEVASVLATCYGSRIEARTALSPGVVRIDYENGVRVYVNYTGSAAQDGAATIPARSGTAVTPDA
ncbi:MAG: DUF5696 domain-containing protein [Candidatus Izemoplasmatales bacterium]